MSNTKIVLGFILVCLVFSALSYFLRSAEKNYWFSEKSESMKAAEGIVQMFEDECILENEFIIEDISREDDKILVACIGKKIKDLLK